MAEKGIILSKCRQCGTSFVKGPRCPECCSTLVFSPEVATKRDKHINIKNEIREHIEGIMEGEEGGMSHD